MTGVLFIHGILGKPDYFDFLHRCIPAEGFYIVSLLLEGHCDTPKAFGQTSMAQWRSQVAEAVDRLKADCSRVVIAAHSMGTLFAIDNAVRGRADTLFLLNPPLSLRFSLRMATTSLKVLRGKADDQWTAAAKAAYSISDDSNPLHYIGWISRYLELFAEIRHTRSVIGRLTVPTRAYISAHDEVVSPRSARWLPLRPDVAVVTLPDSGHYYYPEPDRRRIVSDFSRFLSLS